MANVGIELFAELRRLILLSDASDKCRATAQLAADLDEPMTFAHDLPPEAIAIPGLPAQLQLVAPRQLERRGMKNQSGRNRLMHAVAHIEFNAINLALDAAYRFRHQPLAFYRDWIQVAADEARHFTLIRNYLNEHGCEYGDFPAHNGLWEMAVHTADDVVARMALVPRVLEARGLDVTPAMIKRLEGVNDRAAAAILEIIYQDEIGHVEIGSRWFRYHCQKRGLEPRQTFIKMIETYMHGKLKGPLNMNARLAAGFDAEELAGLNLIAET